MLPEEQAVTKAKKSILSPLRRAAAFLSAQQQVLKVGVYGTVQLGETETLKMPEEIINRY